MEIVIFKLDGRNVCCACLPAGFDRPAFTTRILGELQQIAGPGGIVALCYNKSAAAYLLNAPDDFKPSLHWVLLTLGWTR